LPAPEIEQSLAAAACHILSDRTEIATATQLIGLADNRLPASFSVAELWRMRLQSEVDAGGALNALVDRIDLSGDFKYPAGAQILIPSNGRQPAENAAHIMITPRCSDAD
jgi:hypothetical protein